MSPYVRTVRTASGARAVQIVLATRQGSRKMEHIGSAHDDAELEVLKAAAAQRMLAGQGELDLGLDPLVLWRRVPYDPPELISRTGTSYGDRRRAT